MGSTTQKSSRKSNETLQRLGEQQEQQEQQNEKALRAKQTPAGSWVLVLLGIYITALLYGLDTTVVADVQGTILLRFGEPEKLAWIGVGFPLGSIAVILSLGKAYGIFDMKRLFITSLILFEGGSALCGGAPSINALIVGRVAAGAGGAGMYLGGLNIVTGLTTEHERPLYLALHGVSWGTGTILGPVVGGALAGSSATWRWAFYINLVICAVFAPIYLLLIPAMDPQPTRNTVQKLKDVDWIGSILNAAIYTTWVLALTFGGGKWPWSDSRTITCFVVCGVLIIVFGLQQRFNIATSLEQRILPLSFLTSLSLLLQYFTTACTATALFVPVYYIPVFFQFTKDDGALKAAVRLLPLITVTIFCIMLNGALMPQTGYYKPWYTVSGAFILIGGALMFTINSDTSPARIYGYSVLLAIGTGISAQSAYSVVPVKVAMDPRYGPRMIPDAISFINMAQIGSIVHALAISGTVFQNLAFRHLQHALAGRGFTDAELHGAISGTQSQLLSAASEEVRALAVTAIVKAMDQVYILVIVAGALCFLASLPMKREKLFLKMSAGGG
ncbi:major facilitator superfamily domain-containing protein [Coniochaeta sp. 2T2.1]|nr:major facilitator superfamily domain-containing protein [Coniochaeta sp. 2T2.1]